jgi:hypothetical protein
MASVGHGAPAVRLAAMELLGIRVTETGQIGVSLAYLGGVADLVGTSDQVDRLGAALADAAALASVGTGACVVAHVVVGDRMVRVGLSGAGRVTVVIGPSD